MEKKLNSFDLYISGYKGLKTLQYCFINNLNINKVFFYKSNISNQFYKNIRNFCEKNKINFKQISTKNISKFRTSKNLVSFFIGWQFKMNFLNNSYVFHDSLLPSYIGHSPTVSALINGEKIVGFSIFKPDDDIDSGKIIYQKEYRIKYPIKIYDVYKKITKGIFQSIKIIINKNKIKFKKKKYNKSFAIWRDSMDYFINWNNNSNYLQRFVNSLDCPYDNAKAIYNNKIIKVYNCKIIKDKKFAEYHPGKIVTIDNNAPIVMCKNGLIQLTETKYLNGKKVIFTSIRKRFS